MFNTSSVLVKKKPMFLLKLACVSLFKVSDMGFQSYMFSQCMQYQCAIYYLDNRLKIDMKL
jgi:hypothetical protein